MSLTQLWGEEEGDASSLIDESDEIELDVVMLDWEDMAVFTGLPYVTDVDECGCGRSGVSVEGGRDVMWKEEESVGSQLKRRGAEREVIKTESTARWILVNTRRVVRCDTIAVDATSDRSSSNFLLPDLFSGRVVPASGAAPMEPSR